MNMSLDCLMKYVCKLVKIINMPLNVDKAGNYKFSLLS